MGSSQDSSGDRPRCGARNRQGKPCARPPQPGKTRCWYHGGADRSGAQPRNQNARRHGGYARVILTKQERRIYDEARTDDLAPVIKLLTLRFYRVFQAATAQDRGGELPVVEITTGGSGEKAGQTTTRKRPDLDLTLVRISGRLAHLCAVQHELGMTGDPMADNPRNGWPA